MKKLLFILISLSIVMFASADIIIGTGTVVGKAIPIEPFYGYTYSEVIYLQSDIGAADDITTLSWYFAGTSLSVSNDWTIYMGHTTKTEFSSTTDWITSGSMTQVWTGTFTDPAAAGWITFDITDFAYNNTDNLVIAVDENASGYNGSADDFYCTDVTDVRAITYRNDSTNPDPAAPPTATYIYPNIANITLGGITQACPAPSALTAGTITTTSAILGWTENGTATSWNIELGAAGFTPTGTPTQSGVTNPYTYGSLSPATTYDWYVQADCGGIAGQSVWVGPNTFATEYLAGFVFESFETTFPPDGWQIQNVVGNDWEQYASGSPPDGSYQARLYYTATTGAQSRLVTPKLSITTNYDFIDFYCRYYTAGTLKVQYSSDATSWTDLETVAITADFAKYTVDLSSLISDGEYYIGLLGETGTAYSYIYLDAVHHPPIALVPPAAPTTPYPADDAINVFYLEDLTWINGFATETVDVYFSTNEALVTSKDVSVKVIDNLDVETYDPGTMSFSTEYFWRVVCKNTGTRFETDGPVWSFTTADPPLTGTKTIGTGGDYTTFNDAVTALMASGVGTGGVTFNVLAGTYTEQITIGEIPGASASNPVIFQSAPVDDPAFLQFAATGTADNWIVLLDGADYVTFQNMTFTSTSAVAYGRIFVLQNGATNNNILNNDIVGNASASTSTNLVNIYSTTSAIDSDNTIEGNTITNGSYGIMFDGLSSTIEDNNVIEDNDIQDFYYYGIRMEYQTNTHVIGNNLLDRGVYSTAYGIYMYYCDEAVQVLENIVSLSASSSNYLMYIYYCDGTEEQPLLIANNMLSQTVGTSTAYGIYVYYDSYVNVYNNSININAGSTTTGRALYFYCSNTPASYHDINVLNNAVVNVGGGLAVEITSNAVLAGYVTAMDYNDLYATGLVLGDYGGTDCADLTAWQTASTFDTNSLSVDPLFTGPTNLHANAGALDSSCPRLSEVLVDIDGEARPDPTDMGADEFTPPDCLLPSDLTETTITQTTADLGWTDNNTPAATLWNIELGITGFTPTGTPTQTGVTNPYTYTGLTANTTYDWYVQADCGTDVTSPWAGPSTFTTLCDAVTTYPWSENFDADTITPDCWTNNSTEEWEFSTSAGYGASSDHTSGSGNLAWLDDSTPYDNPSNLDTPEFDVTGLTIPQLKFYYWIGNGNPGSYMCLDIYNGTTWIDSVGYYQPNNQWDLVSVDLSSYSSTTTKIRFRAMENLAGYNCDICIDDVMVRETPSCLEPTALTETNITYNSADLGWTENNTPAATIWDIEIDTTGFIPTGTPTYSGVTSNPYNVTGLSPATGYDWYVRADCGTDEESSWSGPGSFATSVENDSCAVAIAIVGEVTDQPWDTSFATTSGFDTHAINQDIWYAYTPSASGLATFDLCGSSFDTKLALYEECDVLTELGYNDDSAYCDPDERSAQSAILDVPVVFGEDYMVQIGGYSSYSGPGDLTIVLEDCPAPDSCATTNIWQTTADLSWYEYGSTTTWHIEIDTTGFTPTGIATHTGVSNPYTVTGLVSSTDYDWYVISDCGADSSAWVGPNSFTTLDDCPFPTAQTTTMIGPDQADLGWTEMGTAVLWDIEIDTLGATFTGTPDYSGVTNPYTVTGLLNDQAYQWYVRADCGTDDVSIWVGPASFTTLVQCPAPTSPNTTNILATSADLDWTNGWAETYWNVEWDTTGFVQGTGTLVSRNLHPYGLTGLTANTSYDWYVQADCNGPLIPGDESVWVGPITFTTACLTFTPPFLETFDDAGLPDCWTMSGPENWLFSTGAGYGAAVAGDHTPGGGTNYAWVDGSGTGTNIGITLQTPLIDVSGLTVPMLEFYLFSNNTDNPGDNNTLNVDFWDGAAWNNGIYTWTGDNASWFMVRLDLSTYTITGDVQFRFVVDEVAATAFYNDILIDDVVVDEFPSCPAPTALFTSNITDSTAVMNWTAGGIEPNWNIEWGLAGFVQGTGTMIPNTTNPDTLTGLTAAMLYDWYVQADCDGGATRDESAWVGPITFGTTGDGTCDHYVVLTDDYGDGWNGGTLDIYRNGNLAIGGLTLASGAGPDTTGVTANQADSLYFDYTAGSWAYENAYYVYRVYDDALVFSQGTGGVEPIDGSIDYCCPPPTLAIDPSPYDFGNVPYNKTVTQVFTLTNIGDGTVTVNSASDITLTGDPEFTISSIYANNGYPVSLPSDTLTVDVQFAPGAAVGYSTTLSVVWGAVRSVTDATITGTGCTPVPNDDCVNATAINGPYPQSGTGSNECAGIDCPGLLDWYTTWYEIELPYECNDVNIVVCGDGVDLYSVGIVSFWDCLCGTYFFRDVGAFIQPCPNGWVGYDMDYLSLPGPGTMFWPAQAVDLNDNGIPFTWEVNVTPCETPNAPQDVSVAVTGTNVTVSWTYHSELLYTVYSDTDPYGSFVTVEGTGIAADHLDITPIPGVPTFYRVTCDNPVTRMRMYSDGVGITEKAPKVYAPQRMDSPTHSKERK